MGKKHPTKPKVTIEEKLSLGSVPPLPRLPLSGAKTRLLFVLLWFGNMWFTLSSQLEFLYFFTFLQFVHPQPEQSLNVQAYPFAKNLGYAPEFRGAPQVSIQRTFDFFSCVSYSWPWSHYVFFILKIDTLFRDLTIIDHYIKQLTFSQTSKFNASFGNYTQPFVLLLLYSLMLLFFWNTALFYWTYSINVSSKCIYTWCAGITVRRFELTK